MPREVDISWKEVAAVYRDLAEQHALLNERLENQLRAKEQELAEVQDVVARAGINLQGLRVQLGADQPDLTPQDFCEICSEPWTNHSAETGREHKDLIANKGNEPEPEPIVEWDLTKDSEERKWDEGKKIYDRICQRVQEQGLEGIDSETPVVYAYGPDEEHDYEETTFGVLHERYGELELPQDA